MATKKKPTSKLKKVLKSLAKAKKNFPAKKTSPVAACPLKKSSPQKIVVNKAEPNQKIVVITQPNTQKVVVASYNNQEFESINSFFEISGTEDFKNKVRSDLWKLYQTNTGKNLLLNLKNSGKKVKIGIAPIDHKAYPAFAFPDNDSGISRDSQGNPGKGNNANVYYDPDFNINTFNRKDFNDVPMAIVLGHELIHAQHYVSGTKATGEVANDNKFNPKFLDFGSKNPFQIKAMEKREEVETAGIPPNDNRDFTENKLRKEWEPPQSQREYY